MIPLTIPYPEIDPVLIQLGPFAIRWYALAYIAGLVIGWQLMRRLCLRPPRVLSPEKIDDFLLWAALGVILGGRLGYVLFYKPSFFLQNPLQIFTLWEGGMSFHGGLIGTIVALVWFSKRQGLPVYTIADLAAAVTPIGLGFGRLGNFINGELWGRAADPSLPWAMIFPQSGSDLPRHPSQLYQFSLEGMLLFALLWFYARRERPQGAVAGAFMFGYGLFRFTAEYFREPDSFLGLLALNMSMGQWLCVPMIVLGALIWGMSQSRSAQRGAGS